MANSLLIIGALSFALAVPLALWDIHHGFLPWLLGAAILGLGGGLVFQF